jgi:hypothetical protein
MEDFKKILVENGERKKLKELFGCSYPTVRVALKDGNIKTSLGIRIRKAALERGGIELESKTK